MRAAALPISSAVAHYYEVVGPAQHEATVIETLLALSRKECFWSAYSVVGKGPKWLMEIACTRRHLPRIAKSEFSDHLNEARWEGSCATFDPIEGVGDVYRCMEWVDAIISIGWPVLMTVEISPRVPIFRQLWASVLTILPSILMYNTIASIAV